MFRFTKRKANHKTAVKAWTKLLVRYSEKQMVFDRGAKTVTYKNSRRDIRPGSGMPEEYYTEKTAALSDTDAALCTQVITAAIAQLPLSREVTVLPPGASHECWLTVQTPDGNTLYYTNCYIGKNAFSISKDPAHPQFLEVFHMLCGYCMFPDLMDLYEPQNARGSVDEDPWYANETLWLCRKCDAGNRMKDRYCANCGEYRGW